MIALKLIVGLLVFILCFFGIVVVCGAGNDNRDRYGK